MAAAAQNYKNHTRFDPTFHFFLVWVFLITIILAIIHLVRHPGFPSAWFLVLSIAWLLTLGRARVYSLKTQDRIIRLEERLRLATLLPEAQRENISRLSERQLIALRFASDAELPALAERAWREGLEPKQIKQAIQSWRADYFRV
jgi:hypothetical protein